IYQVVTDRILASLKEGLIRWEKPWQAPTYAGGNFPRNFATGRPYQGVNVMLLWSTPYSAPFWLTYKQAKELGGAVRKGEKGTPIVFYKQFTGKKDGTHQTSDQPAEQPDDQDAGKARTAFMLISYTVFNVEQCEGLNLPERLPSVELDLFEQDAACEALVNSWEGRPTLQLLSQTERRAFYRPPTDTVHMRARFRFVEPALYYSTLFHELVHSTGHEIRLNRTFGSSFGDDLYSREELVAETGAAFLCAIAGISNEHTDRNTTAYLQNWIRKLEGDNRLILQASAAAQKAVDLITGQTKEEEQPA
ncbi:MAG: ArdC family protein, partial [Janthinobacterium lividum]